MLRRTQIEVFKDSSSAWLDSDDLAHALATITALKPYIEIINRQRQLTLPESHSEGILDIDSRVRVVLDTAAAVLYTDRRIIGENLSNANEVNGVYLPDSKVCVVGSNSVSTWRTVRHELGHFVYDRIGVVSATGNELTDHCANKQCVMHEFLISDKRMKPIDMKIRLAEEFGIRAFQYTDATVPTDYCPSCEEAIVRSAEIRVATQNDPTLVDTILFQARR